MKTTVFGQTYEAPVMNIVEFKYCTVIAASVQSSSDGNERFDVGNESEYKW